MSKHFWVSLVAPTLKSLIEENLLDHPLIGDERKIRCHYPKVAAEIFIQEYFNMSVRYKPNVFIVQVREPDSNKIWKFGITTTILAKKIK